MTPSASTHLSKHHRLPGEIIRHAVWRYCRFPLRHRDVEALLCVRGVLGSYEAMRMRCRTCGQPYAHQRRRRRSWPGEQWHVDAVGITMTNEQHALGRAVDQDGVVLDILVQRRQHQQAAKKFFRTLLKGCQYAPRVVIPDKRKSDGASKRAMLPGMQHRQHRSLNNHAEHSLQPTRQWERHMQRCKSPGQPC